MKNTTRVPIMSLQSLGQIGAEPGHASEGPLHLVTTV